MNPDAATYLRSELPFQIPCPPPALRLPPPVYKLPPETHSHDSNSIPSAPSGARVPGDRIAWIPIVFPEVEITHALSNEGAAADMFGDENANLWKKEGLQTSVTPGPQAAKPQT